MSCRPQLSSEEAVKRVLAGDKLDPKGKASSSRSQDKENREGRERQRDQVVRPGASSTKPLEVKCWYSIRSQPVHIILLIMISKAKLVLDQQYYSEMLYEYGPDTHNSDWTGCIPIRPWHTFELHSPLYLFGQWSKDFIFCSILHHFGFKYFHRYRCYHFRKESTSCI